MGAGEFYGAPRVPHVRTNPTVPPPHSQIGRPVPKLGPSEAGRPWYIYEIFENLSAVYPSSFSPAPAAFLPRSPNFFLGRVQLLIPE